ncbi:MAG: LUD domain-containing protein [Paludibacter sp.]
MSRASILDNIRRNKPSLELLPEIPEYKSDSKDLLEQFKKNLSQVGGQAIEIAEKDIAKNIKEHFGPLKFIVSNDKSLNVETIDSTKITDLKEFDNLDLVVLRSGFGVAENGAVWISSNDISHRVLPFIAEHAVFIVQKNEMVSNMHEAYKRINLLETKGFGTFISGPSKTADIEQSLVIGAHGAKSLIVYLT